MIADAGNANGVELATSAASAESSGTAIGLDATKAAGSNHQLSISAPRQTHPSTRRASRSHRRQLHARSSVEPDLTVATTAAGSGFINAAIADTSDHIGIQHHGRRRQGTTIAAAGNVRATADGKTNASTKATAYAVGFRAGADADYATSGGIQIGDYGTPPRSIQVEIGSGSNINGQTVTLLASNSEIDASANDSTTSSARSCSASRRRFANANVDAMPSATVLIDNTIGVSPATQLTGSQGVDILAFDAVPADCRRTGSPSPSSVVGVRTRRKEVQGPAATAPASAGMPGRLRPGSSRPTAPGA